MTNTEKYMYFTKVVLPMLAATNSYPVAHDHCFQRIVLDHVCGCVWHTKIQRPAYKHLTEDQAAEAVKLCEGIISGELCIHILNDFSKMWRKKLKKELSTSS